MRSHTAAEGVSAHQAEPAESLRDGEASFRAVFEHAAIGIGVVDMDGRPTAANAALARLLGYSARELAAMTFSDFTHPDDVQTDLDLFAELMAGSRESYHLEKRYIRSDGDIVCARLAVSLIRDAEGRPEFAVAMIEDVTELRRAEAALRESEERQRGAQKMEAIGRLAGGIAHDFNNLLTVVIGSAEMLDAIDGEADSSRRDQTLRIREAAERAATLTRKLLAFARRQRFDAQVTDLNRLIVETLALLRRVVPSDIAIESRLDPELHSVWADPSQLEQVIMNLALNARDAMPAGGLLEITTANVRLAEPLPTAKTVIPTGDYVLLTVLDNGGGMDATTLSHVFEPFFTTKPDGSGTGLGLATVFGIVKQSGGFIVVESEPDRGTSFAIYLPRTTTEFEAEAETPDWSRSSGATVAPGAILVVDDDPAVRAVVTEMLESGGYTVLAAPSVEAALDQAAGLDFQVDLVVSDLVMPHASGTELVAELRRRSSGPIRVLYVSGYSEERLGPEHGGLFLSKPFTSEALLSAVERALA